MSRTTEAIERVGREMDRIAAATPPGPWREPIKRPAPTEEQMNALLERLWAGR